MLQIRTGQSSAASRWDSEDGTHTWPCLDSVEIDAMSEDPRAWAYMAMADQERN